MTNTGAPAIRYAIPVLNSSYAYSTLTVGGRVDGGAQTGVQLLRQSTGNGYGSLNLTMTVAAGGSVSGANGIVVGQTGSDYGQTTATIDNSGTGTNGYALLSTSSYAGFQSITNPAGGTIGAISGAVYGSGWTNSGTIVGDMASTAGQFSYYTSTIVGGAGTDTLCVRLTSDATLSSALALPTSFEQLTLTPDAKITTTLARGFTVASPLCIGGSWTSDLSVHYAAELAEGWALTPRAGLTYLRTRRQGVGETGGSPFALTVARRDLVAGFADAGATFGRSDASDAPFRPFVTLSARYQIEGNRAVALGGYAGGGQGLVALGAARAPLVGTATGGVAYRFANGVDLYATGSAQTGRDDHQETIAAGLRLRF